MRTLRRPWQVGGGTGTRTLLGDPRGGVHSPASGLTQPGAEGDDDTHHGDQLPDWPRFSHPARLITVIIFISLISSERAAFLANFKSKFSSVVLKKNSRGEFQNATGF